MNTRKDTRSGDPAVVIEVGNEWIKVVQVGPARHGTQSVKVHYEPVPEDPTQTGAVLADMLAKRGFAQGPVIGCLPRQVANVRMLELPSTDLNEIADMVDLQVGKQTPYSKDEIAYDYIVFGAGRQGYTKVLLAIVQRVVLRQRFAVFEDAGLTVSRVTVSSEGLLKWYARSSLSETTHNAVILLDIDASSTDCAVLADGGVAYMRSLSIGMDHLSRDGDSWREKFAGEVKRAIVACSSEMPDVRAGKVVVTGASKRVGWLPDFLENQLGLAVEAVSCMEEGRVRVTPDALPPGADAHSFTALLGLGMAAGGLALNLIPDSVRQRTQLIRKARGLTVFASLLMTTLFALMLLTTVVHRLRLGELRERRDRVAATSARVESVSRMRDLIKLIRTRGDLSHSIVRELQELHSLTPPALYFESVDISPGDGTMQLEGQADAPKSIRQLVKNLENSDFFANAQEGTTQRDDKTTLYRFRITCSLEGTR